MTQGLQEPGATGAARLVSTPSVSITAWLGIATNHVAEVSPTLSSYTARVSPGRLNSAKSVASTNSATSACSEIIHIKAGVGIEPA